MDRIITGLAVSRWREFALSLGILFASTCTLICCALPILLVSLGLGAGVAALTASTPWLIELSRWGRRFGDLAAVALSAYRTGSRRPPRKQPAGRCARAERRR